jgi:CDP-diacylglycerol---serine O-phosphatidyltransferase
MKDLPSPAGAFHPANLLTYASLWSGIAAVAAATAGHQHAAAAWIAASVVADTFDGRFARMFQRTGEQRAVGVQLDSLSDAIAFGIAPALLWRPAAGWGALEGVWWIAVAAYAACAITRLAFYNVTHEAASGFVGLPVPVAALVSATALLFAPGPAALTALFATTALAMVLPLPIARPQGLGLAAFVSWPLLVILANLWQ